MPAAEHAPAPHPLPIPKDDPVAPKRPIVESLDPLPPSNLVPDPPEQKEKILETEREPSLPEVRLVSPPPPPPEESEPEEVIHSSLLSFCTTCEFLCRVAHLQGCS